MGLIPWQDLGTLLQSSGITTVIKQRLPSFPPLKFFLPWKGHWVQLEAFIKDVKCLDSRETSRPGGHWKHRAFYSSFSVVNENGPIGQEG